MFDVLVIGAGLSGLQAAYSAQREGLSTVVLEARDRVGGKTWTVPLASGRGNVDLGAAWINDTMQPRIWAYVKKFGLTAVKQRIEGRAIMQESPDHRFEFPFGTTPEVRYYCLKLFPRPTTPYQTISSMPNCSSLRKRKRTWNTSVTISKQNL